jgi:hypothetical protein
MKMAAEINGLLAASAGLIGAIIGGVLVYLASIRAATVQTRANYVLQIIGRYPSEYGIFFGPSKMGMLESWMRLGRPCSTVYWLCPFHPKSKGNLRIRWITENGTKR